ncbi:ATP-dependent nuclease [Streptomyces vinaceus]|uniref:ATP-dependent nuclease n=1 Tax=Streptomyces vinaceus TaxID=1960 RepID=UPI0035DFCDB5
MHLNSFGVSGFRSLTEIAGIPVGKPTILAGHNDGGKSAVLGALAFLLGKHELTLDDRTYVDAVGGDESTLPLRCAETSVVGCFTLDTWEQDEFDLPERIRLRRCAGEDLVSRLELWEAVPDDERLRDLSQYQVPDAKVLVKELELSPLSMRKPDLLKALRAYGREHASSEGWVGAPPGLGKRMPRYLPFDGKAARPDDAVRTALVDRFASHMADPELKGRLAAIEGEVQDRLRLDAKSLCDHIQTHCPDLQKVSVDPDVSFQQGFKGAPLRIARHAGEAVGLERTGLGSNRRISLAIWEWTQELLAAEEDTAPTVSPGTGEPLEPPSVQTIVVYDEPDTHLDYTHQRKIMQLIRAQSDVRDVNVVVATHSMNLIDRVDISDVVHLKLENHRTVVERLGAGVLGEEIDEYLGKIAAAVGLRNSVLLHERCFPVEGETEQQAFPLLFRLCEGLSLQAAGIALWACFNNEGALHLARYLVKQGRTVMLVVDADSRNVNKSIFKAPKLTQFFGTGASRYVKFLGEPQDDDPQGEMFNELEELFTDGVWARVANKIWPKDDSTWQPTDFAALRGQGKFSAEVQQMLQSGSGSGPGGKPRMMSDLAMALDDPKDVPKQLRSVFKELRRVAS